MALNFRQYGNITEIVIPNSVKHNGSFENKFMNMKNLKHSTLPDNIEDMDRVFLNCFNLLSSHVCGDFVTSMEATYTNCYNLTGSPMCGNNVTSMYRTYENCINLTGSPVCGDNVTSMYRTYYNCRNLTGSPTCGNKVTDMSGTYWNCQNLTGSPVCGDKVASMQQTYYNCINLTGSPVCGPNVTEMYGTYWNCYNLYGNAYFYSNNIIDSYSCFEGRNTSNRLNIFVHKDTTSVNTLMDNNVTKSIVSDNITWVNDVANSGAHYNTAYNIYIYPVPNVAATRELNGD